MSYDIGSGSTWALGPSASDMKVDCDAWSEFNLRWPSVHRRHGDPYPLPRHGQPSAAEPLTRLVRLTVWLQLFLTRPLTRSSH